MIDENVDASPEDVKNFFEKNKSELPRVNEEVELAHIIIYPEITEAHKQQIIDSLKQIKKILKTGKVLQPKQLCFRKIQVLQAKADCIKTSKEENSFLSLMP